MLDRVCDEVDSPVDAVLTDRGVHFPTAARCDLGRADRAMPHRAARLKVRVRAPGGLGVAIDLPGARPCPAALAHRNPVHEGEPPLPRLGVRKDMLRRTLEPPTLPLPGIVDGAGQLFLRGYGFTVRRVTESRAGPSDRPTGRGLLREIHAVTACSSGCRSMRGQRGVTITPPSTSL